MNLYDTFKVLLRRWYVLLLGVALAVGGALYVWNHVDPRYERSSTQVLLPGKDSLPQDGHNPYLYLGGITLAADIVVRAVGSENVANEIQRSQPGVTFEVSRDPSTAGPVIMITVNAATDEQAALVLGELTARTASVLDQLQRAEGIPASERMTVVTVTMDDHGVLKDRTRLLLSVGVGLAIVVFSVLMAAIIDGVARRLRTRSKRATEQAPVASQAQEEDHAGDVSDQSDPYLPGAAIEDGVVEEDVDHPAEHLEDTGLSTSHDNDVAESAPKVGAEAPGDELQSLRHHGNEKLKTDIPRANSARRRVRASSQPAI